LVRLSCHLFNHAENNPSETPAPATADAKARTKKPRCQEPKKEYKEPTLAGAKKKYKNKKSKKARF